MSEPSINIFISSSFLVGALRLARKLEVSASAPPFVREWRRSLLCDRGEGVGPLPGGSDPTRHRAETSGQPLPQAFVRPSARFGTSPIEYSFGQEFWGSEACW